MTVVLLTFQLQAYILLLTIEGVSERYRQTLCTSPTYHNKRKNMHSNVSGNVYFVNYGRKRTFIISAQNCFQEIDATLNTYHKLLHLLATVSVTGIHNAVVKYPLIAHWSCIYNGFEVSPQVKVQRIQIW
jgi:hypothetical protein